MKLTTSLCAAALLFASAAVSSPVKFILPRQTQIGDVFFKGSGCPQDTGGASVPSDGHAVSVIYDVFYTVAGPGVSPADGNRKCEMVFKLRCPDGNYKFSVNSRVSSGLVAGSSVNLKTVITYPDGTLATSTRTRSGPENGDNYSLNHNEFSNKQFPCHRNGIWFKVEQTMDLSAGTATEEAFWQLSGIDAGINLA